MRNDTILYSKNEEENTLMPEKNDWHFADHNVFKSFSSYNKK